jgi:hypothetical protein
MRIQGNHESDRLRHFPLAFAQDRYEAKEVIASTQDRNATIVRSSHRPTFLVMYPSTAAALAHQLPLWQYTLQATFFHSLMSIDVDNTTRDTHMLVFRHDTT